MTAAALDRLSSGYYAATTALVVLGVAFGQSYVQRAKYHPASRDADLIGAFAVWDGEHYVRIADEGYSYDPERMSNVAFYPAFPLLGRAVARLTGWRTEYALLLVAQVSLLGSFIMLGRYVTARTGEADSVQRTLLAFGLFPTTFYLRMAYTESTFILLAILVLYGMKQRWPVVVLAVLAGAATATRAIGVALAPVLLLHVWERCHAESSLRAALLSFTWRAILLGPLACWGLLGFMAYQQAAFGTPLASVQTQRHWAMRPSLPAAEQILAAASLEPLGDVYDSTYPCPLDRDKRGSGRWFSMSLANPLYFVLAVALVVVGGVKGWLDRTEVVFSGLVLAISYFSKGYECCMVSQARYAATAFPTYLVLGRLLARLPVGALGIVCAWSGFLLAAYAALFTRWYAFY